MAISLKQISISSINRGRGEKKKIHEETPRYKIWRMKQKTSMKLSNCSRFSLQHFPANPISRVWGSPGDNCSIHKGEEIEKAIVDVGAQLIYLPPYSPDFNPIEQLWSKVKNILRSIGARTYKDLDLAIAKAYSQVSLKDIRNWFATRS